MCEVKKCPPAFMFRARTISFVNALVKTHMHAFRPKMLARACSVNPNQKIFREIFQVLSGGDRSVKLRD